MAIAENKSERIEVRTTSTLKALLQRAAASSHKNVTEFLLEGEHPVALGRFDGPSTSMASLSGGILPMDSHHTSLDR